MLSYKGKKIQLRPLKFTDKERSIIWRNDPAIRDLALSYRFPVTEAMEDNWYNKAMAGEDPTKVFFAIENCSDSKHIGFIHLYNIDYIASNSYFAITIGDKSEHGKGKATEAMHILFQFAFKHLNMHKINLEVASFNSKAVDLYHRFGFKKEGVLRKQVYISGHYYDKYCMGIFRDEYYKKYPEYLSEEVSENADKN